MLRPTLVTALLTLALAPSAQGEVVRERALSAAGLERALEAGGRSLSLANGRGYAVVRSRAGAMLASVGAGRVVVKNFARGPRTEGKVWGCNAHKRVGRRTFVCSGRDLSLSIVDGRWSVVLRGSRINASAVLRGKVALAGTVGTYAIDGGPARAWPRSVRILRLR